MPSIRQAASSVSKYMNKYFAMLNKYKKKYDKDWRVRLKELKKNQEKYTSSYKKKKLEGAKFEKYEFPSGEKAWVRESDGDSVFVAREGDDKTYQLFKVGVKQENGKTVPDMNNIIGMTDFTDVDALSKGMMRPKQLELTDPFDALSFMSEQVDERGNREMSAEELYDFAKNGFGLSDEQILSSDVQVFSEDEIKSLGIGGEIKSDDDEADELSDEQDDQEDSDDDFEANGDSGQCQHVTEDGDQCKNNAEDGSKYCPLHNKMEGKSASMFEEMMQMVAECMPKHAEQAPRMRCAFINEAGKRCTRNAKYGNYCWQHRQDKTAGLSTIDEFRKVVTDDGIIYFGNVDDGELQLVAPDGLYGGWYWQLFDGDSVIDEMPVEVEMWSTPELALQDYQESMGALASRRRGIHASISEDDIRRQLTTPFGSGTSLYLDADFNQISASDTTWMEGDYYTFGIYSSSPFDKWYEDPHLVYRHERGIDTTGHDEYVPGADRSMRHEEVEHDSIACDSVDEAIQIVIDFVNSGGRFAGRSAGIFDPFVDEGWVLDNERSWFSDAGDCYVHKYIDDTDGIAYENGLAYLMSWPGSGDGGFGRKTIWSGDFSSIEDAMSAVDVAHEQYSYVNAGRNAGNFATAPRVPDDVDIDSNNVDACPLCGDPNFDGEFCNVCGYEEPPEGFDDIELETEDDYDEYEQDSQKDVDDKPSFDPDEISLDKELEDKANELADNVEDEDDEDEYGVNDDEMSFV